AAQVLAGLPAGYRVLEVGCGTGNVLRFLAKACPNGTVVGMDLYAEGLSYARRRVDCPLVVADVNRAPFRRGFHLIGAFDVLEHISDDGRILDGFWNLLESDGKVLITVPAHEFLWSYFDDISGHCRRYEAKDLRSRLESAGFEVQFLSPYMTCVYPMLL